MNNFFIETEYYLESAYKLYQYILDDRLITLIGENHIDNFKCNDKKSISIADYVNQKIQKNSKAIVYLEYYDQNPQYIMSHSIKSVTKIIKNDRIVPYDKRVFFLNTTNKDRLYRNFKETDYENKMEIYKLFVKPYFDKKDEFEKYKNYKHDIKKILDLINFDISIRFEDIKNKLLKNNIKLKYPEKIKIINNLRKLWSDVCDYFLVSHILLSQNKNCNEHIIISGNNHIDNIKNILENSSLSDCIKIKSFIQSDVDNKKSCIKIYNNINF
jgi:hypothetical protein